MSLSPEQIAIVEQVWAENPTLAPSRKNGELVAAFLEENHCDFSAENLRIAIRVLGYPTDRLERQQPPAPPQPVELAEPAEPELPPVPKYLEHLKSKADVLACSKYREWYFGKDARQFRERVNEILRRAALAGE